MRNESEQNFRQIRNLVELLECEFLYLTRDIAYVEEIDDKDNTTVLEQVAYCLSCIQFVSRTLHKERVEEVILEYIYKDIKSEREAVMPIFFDDKFNKRTP